MDKNQIMAYLLAHPEAQQQAMSPYLQQMQQAQNPMNQMQQQGMNPYAQQMQNQAMSPQLMQQQQRAMGALMSPTPPVTSQPGFGL